MTRGAGALFFGAVTIRKIGHCGAPEARRTPEVEIMLGGWLDRILLELANRTLPFNVDKARRLSAKLGHDETNQRTVAAALIAGFTVAMRNTQRYASNGIALIDSFKSSPFCVMHY